MKKVFIILVLILMISCNVDDTIVGGIKINQEVRGGEHRMTLITSIKDIREYNITYYKFDEVNVDDIDSIKCYRYNEAREYREKYIYMRNVECNNKHLTE